MPNTREVRLPRPVLQPVAAMPHPPRSAASRPLVSDAALVRRARIGEHPGVSPATPRDAALPAAAHGSADDELDGVLVARIVGAWPDPILVADRAGRVVAMNAAARELLAVPAGGAAPKLDAFTGAQAAADLLAAGLAAVERVAGDDSAQGGRRLLRFRASALGDAHVVVSAADATIEARLRSHLGHAERLASVGEHLSSVAHELNNPLTTVLGYADLLLGENDPHLPREEIERIRSEALRCRRIVGNLLDLARADAVELRPLVVREVVEKVVEFRAYGCRSAGIELTSETLETPVVMGDFHRLVQCVLNLVTNAEDAVRPRPAPRRVTVRTGTCGDRVVVEVTDNGGGVPAAIRPFVFQPFFTTKPRGKGTGLGLSLVRGTARQHGGDVRCEDTEGGGARFVIELPAVPPGT